MKEKTKFEQIVGLPKPYRVLSMDGGGIYGLFTALMLKKLCERDKTFLKGSQITLFAGTSAGALISLLLAKEENPRDAVMSGELEDIFANGLMYNNRYSPLNAVLSYTFLTPWTGSTAAERLYKQHFGDKSLGELKHRVLISSFDMSGSALRKNRSWKPKVFYNFPDDEPDRDLLVRDVAYGATSPLGWRPVKEGITDGYVFADNPCIQAITKISQQTRRVEFARNRFSDVIVRGLVESAYYQRQILLRVSVDDGKKEDSEPDFGKDCGELSRKLEWFAKEIKKLEKEFEMEGKGLNSNFIDVKDRYLTTLEEQKDFFAGASRKPGGDDDANIKKVVFELLTLSIEDLRFVRESFIQLDLSPLTREQEEIPEKIMKLQEKMMQLKDEIDKSSNGRLELFKKIGILLSEKDRIYSIIEPAMDEALRNMSVLSLGVGNNIPYYFKNNFNFGAFPIYTVPTNFLKKEFFNPMTRLTLEPLAEGATYQARQLLGHEKFHRLCPGVLDFPLPPASVCIFLSRYTPWRKWIVKEIRKKVEIEKAQLVEEAIQNSLDWIEKNEWPAWEENEREADREEAPDGGKAPDGETAEEKILAMFSGMSEEDRDELLKKMSGES